MDVASVIGRRYVRRLSATDENSNSLLKQPPQEENEESKATADKGSIFAPAAAEQLRSHTDQAIGEGAPRPAHSSEPLGASVAEAPPPSHSSLSSQPMLSSLPPPPQRRQLQPSAGDVSTTKRPLAPAVKVSEQSAAGSLERLIERHLGNAFSSPVPAAGHQAKKLYFVGNPRASASAAAASASASDAEFQRTDKLVLSTHTQSLQAPQRRPLSAAQAEFAQALENLSCDQDPSELFEVDSSTFRCGLRGRVHTAVDRRDDSLVEIEVIAIEEHAGDLYPLCRELIAASKLEHTGLAEQAGYYFRRSTGQLWVVARRPSGVTLAELAGNADAPPLGEERVAHVVHQCLLTLRYLQQHGFNYNLLNAEAIYIGEDGSVKLSRLGMCTLAWSATSSRRGTCARSLHYASAPEVIKRKPPSPKSDTWSVGVLAYELLHRRRPHQDLEPEAALSKTARRGLRKMAKAITASSEAINFLDRCLRKHPLKRATTDEIARHPFLRKGAAALPNASTSRAA